MDIKILEVIEQKPVINSNGTGSIYCEVKLKSFRDDYFVCDLDKNITQLRDYFITYQTILKQLRELGYKWNGK